MKKKIPIFHFWVFSKQLAEVGEWKKSTADKQLDPTIKGSQWYSRENKICSWRHSRLNVKKKKDIIHTLKYVYETKLLNF